MGLKWIYVPVTVLLVAICAKTLIFDSLHRVKSCTFCPDGSICKRLGFFGFVCFCEHGFTGKSIEGQLQCEDVDECTESPGPCDPEREDCTNANGGFECDCKEGLEKQGDYCLEPASSAMSSDMSSMMTSGMSSDMSSMMSSDMMSSGMSSEMATAMSSDMSSDMSSVMSSDMMSSPVIDSSAVASDGASSDIAPTASGEAMETASAMEAGASSAAPDASSGAIEPSMSEAASSAGPVEATPALDSSAAMDMSADVVGESIAMSSTAAPEAPEATARR